MTGCLIDSETGSPAVRAHAHTRRTPRTITADRQTDTHTHTNTDTQTHTYTHLHTQTQHCTHFSHSLHYALQHSTAQRSTAQTYLCGHMTHAKSRITLMNWATLQKYSTAQSRTAAVQSGGLRHHAAVLHRTATRPAAKRDDSAARTQNG